MLVLLAIGIATLPDLREVFTKIATGTFQVVFTPIILETTMMIGGFLLVIVIVSVLRMREDKDEWVYLSQVDPETVDESIPQPLKKRIESGVFSEEEVMIEIPDDVTVETIEGFIRLNMFDEAIDELMKLREAGENRTTMRLQWMLAMRSKGEAEANKLAAEWLAKGVVKPVDIEGWKKEI